MPPLPSFTPIRLFTAITRAVRDEPLKDDVRDLVFEMLAKLAEQVHQPAFARSVEELFALAQQDAQLGAVLAPFARPLRCLSTAYSVANNPAARDMNDEAATAEDR